MPEKFGLQVVTRVYLADHKGLYQNPRLHPLSPTPKTHRFKPRKLQSDAVPKSTDFGLVRSEPEDLTSKSVEPTSRER
jgi:hypothetical protein